MLSSSSKSSSPTQSSHDSFNSNSPLLLTNRITGAQDVPPAQDAHHTKSNTHHASSNPCSHTTAGTSSSHHSILNNFILFALLFSANHGAVASCISLATARLGDIGTTQNSVLYLSYTLSALVGSTYVVKTIGSFHSVILGMVIYCLYILSFTVASISTAYTSGTLTLHWLKDVAIILGGFIGGIGGGFLWLAQGTYYAKASQLYTYEYAKSQDVYTPTCPTCCCIPTSTQNQENQTSILLEDSTTFFAGIFAFIYLTIEVVMRLFSSFMIQVCNWSWVYVFAGYAVIAALATVLMKLIVHDVEHVYDDTNGVDDNVHTFVHGNDNEYNDNFGETHSLLDCGDSTSNNVINSTTCEDDNNNNNNNNNNNLHHHHQQQQQQQDQQQSTTTTAFYKATITFRLLLRNPKMKYIFPICALFGLSVVFITTFVNAQVLLITLHDDKSIYIGLFTSITSVTAGIMSFIFGIVAPKIGNGTILIIGCLSFFMISFLFIIIPDLEVWNMPLLLLVYAFQGLGRATFEGALKAEFSIIFNEEKEGAFGNIIFQNGLITTIGFYLASNWRCTIESRHCIQYTDGSLHNIFGFECLIVITSILAILGYFRAKWMHRQEMLMMEEYQGQIQSNIIPVGVVV